MNTLFHVILSLPFAVWGLFIFVKIIAMFAGACKYVGKNRFLCLYGMILSLIYLSVPVSIIILINYFIPWK